MKGAKGDGQREGDEEDEEEAAPGGSRVEIIVCNLAVVELIMKSNSCSGETG